jgi:hypothetical protein
MEQCRFLVWNICKKEKVDKLDKCIDGLNYWINQYQLDVLVLIECLADHALTLKDTLTDWQLLEWEQMPINIKKEDYFNRSNNIRIFTRKSSKFQFREWNISDYKKYQNYHPVDLKNKLGKEYNHEIAIRKRNKRSFPLFSEILNKFRFLVIQRDEKDLGLGAFIHLYDKSNTEQRSNNEVLSAILSEILKESSSHFVAGDLNYNPYDDFLFTKNEVNSAFKSLPNKKAFVASNTDLNDYYYNPSWKLLTDSERLLSFGNNALQYTPSYGFFRNQPNNGERYFNLLDGILMTKELINQFDDSFFQLLDFYYTDNHSFRHLYAEDGLSLNSLYSDHLPFIFAISY